MLKNYFKIAWRTFSRSKGYSLLNIVGLAIGMSVALIIGLWIYKEITFDRFLPGYQQAYLVRRNFDSNGDTLNFTSTSLKLADALRQQIPEIAAVAESDGFDMHGLWVGDKKLYLEGGQIGADFLKILQFPLLKGNAATVLKDTYSIVLTESTAKALFGDREPVGKMVRLDNQHDLRVTGILKDIPDNASLHFSFLIPFQYYERTQGWVRDARGSGYGWNSFNIYASLKKDADFAIVSRKIRDIEKTEKDNGNAMRSQVILQPLAHWHLFGNYVNGREQGGFLQYVNLFGIIGILVLVIACINFINLTTARSEKRAREVGVRKAIGSQRKDLILQFLIESMMLALMAFILSILFVQLALPSFNLLTKSRIQIPFGNISFWIIALVSVLLTGLAAGSRPAFYLSAFNPVEVLKGTLGGTGRKSYSRKILVVLQFSCSIALIISTIIVFQQIRYAKDRPTGLQLNRLMVTYMNDDLSRNFTALKTDLLSTGMVAGVTTASVSATNVNSHTDVDQWPGKGPTETIEMGNIHVSEDYFKTIGMTMQEGRAFNNPNDTLNVIFNQTAIRQMRIKNPIGRRITWQGRPLTIVGVARDALMLSPFAPADPTMFVYFPGSVQSTVLYRLSSSVNTAAAVSKLTGIFNQYSPAFPYNYSFSDTDYEEKFQLELLVGKLAALFAGLAIFISCLGLFGLAAYMAEQRNKEIGIRKVLGASIGQVWMLLSKDFIWLVLISCLIASPVAFYFLQHWLEQYSYRILINPMVFFIAAAIALLITLVTISFQSVRAALANPVKSLRSE